MKINDNKKITIHLKTTQFEQLNKRLLLQPVTISAHSTQEGGLVRVEDDKGVNAVSEHVAATIQERLIKDTMNEHFESKDVYPEWVDARLVPHLHLSTLSAPWTEALKEDIKGQLTSSAQTHSPFDVDAYSPSEESGVLQEIWSYAKALEETTFYGVVERTVSAFKEDTPGHEVPTSDEAMELTGVPTNMSFVVEGEELFHSKDLDNGFLNIYADKVYFPGSKRQREVQFYAFTLMMMSRWGIKEWNVPESVYENLETYRKRLDIPVVVDKIVEPIPAV